MSGVLFSNTSAAKPAPVSLVACKLLSQSAFAQASNTKLAEKSVSQKTELAVRRPVPDAEYVVALGEVLSQGSERLEYEMPLWTRQSAEWRVT